MASHHLVKTQTFGRPITPDNGFSLIIKGSVTVDEDINGSDIFGVLQTTSHIENRSWMYKVTLDCEEKFFLHYKADDLVGRQLCL